MGFWNFIRATIVPLFVIPLTTVSYAQQGAAGGFGGGGFGGGDFGDGNSNHSGVYPQRSGDTPSDSYLWNMQSMILTQGDKVEWKVSGKKGQTLFAYATSDVFDAALSVVDPDGKIVAENDDQLEGDQSPFVDFYFPDDREYKITVKNYRSSAGGRFKLFSRFLPTVNLEMGETKFSSSMIESPSGDRRTLLLRLHCEKGKTYSITKPQSTRPNNYMALYPTTVIGPTGVTSQDLIPYMSWNKDSVFEAKISGDYYVYISSLYPGEYSVHSGPVDVIESSENDQRVLKINPFEFRIIKFDVKRGDIVRFVNDFEGEFALKSTYSQTLRKDSSNSPRIKDDNSFVTLMDQANDLDWTSLYHDDGQVTLVANSIRNQAITFHYSSTTALPEFPLNKLLESRVGIGQTLTYVLRGRKGDIIRMNGEAAGMELTYSLFSPDREPMVFINRRTHKPSTFLTLTTDCTYLVTVSSAGQGGSGTFTIKSSKAIPKKYVVGTIGHGDPSEFVENYFDVDLEANCDYDISVEGTNVFPNLQDIDDQTFGMVTMTKFDHSSVVRYRTKKAGTYRLHLDQATGATKFKIEKVLPPKFGIG